MFKLSSGVLPFSCVTKREREREFVLVSSSSKLVTSFLAEDMHRFYSAPFSYSTNNTQFSDSFSIHPIFKVSLFLCFGPPALFFFSSHFSVLFILFSGIEDLFFLPLEFHFMACLSVTCESIKG